MLATAHINVGEVFLAKDAFNAGDFGYGLIFGATGTGLVIGSFVVGLVIGRIRMAYLYGGAIAVTALGFGGAAVSPDVWVAAVCCVVGGIGNGGAIVCNSLLVQRGAPDELRGRAFTVIMSVNYIVLGSGMVIAGFVNNSLGPRWAWGIAALLLVVASGVAFVLTRRIAERLRTGVGTGEPPGSAVGPLLEGVGAGSGGGGAGEGSA
jgi:MFS family permease